MCILNCLRCDSPSPKTLFNQPQLQSSNTAILQTRHLWKKGKRCIPCCSKQDKTNNREKNHFNNLSQQITSTWKIK